MLSCRLNVSVSVVLSTSAPVTTGGGERLPSTLCPAAPDIGRPLFVSVAASPSASWIVAPDTRNTTRSLVALAG